MNGESKELELHDRIVELRRIRDRHEIDESTYTAEILKLIATQRRQAVRGELEKMKREWGYGDTGMDWEEWTNARLAALDQTQEEDK
jgi:hypothetical protein